MKYGFDFNKNEMILDEPKKHNKTEEKVIESIMNSIGISDYTIEKKSDDYTSLLYKERDLFRIKYTDKAQWISILMFPNMRKEFADNELFSAQKNKNQVFWKSNIKNIFDYKEILLEAIKQIDNQ